MNWSFMKSDSALKLKETISSTEIVTNNDSNLDKLVRTKETSCLVSEATKYAKTETYASRLLALIDSATN